MPFHIGATRTLKTRLTWLLRSLLWRSWTMAISIAGISGASRKSAGPILRDNHELYCAGHMLEGAVAYFQTTGRRKLLDIMLRYVDHMIVKFGRGEGQTHGYCGHQEIELALLKLYAVTHEKKHLDLARYFIDERGALAPLF